jgi:hypothetical protein
LCKIVHKMVENARFFAQKRTFLHIFAGGRDDFLAGPKSAFFGFRESRERPRPRQDFASKIPARCKSHRASARQMYVSRASIATAILLSGRTNKHSELAERPEAYITHLLLLTLIFICLLCYPAQRGLHKDSHED